MLSPAFSIEYIASLEPLMASCVKDLVYKIDDSLKRNISSGGVVLNIVNFVQSCAVVSCIRIF